MSQTASRRPRLALDLALGERKASWLELFYDLVYVATVIRLGDLLAAELDLAGATRFAFLFVLVWWNWTGAMFFANRFVADDAAHRWATFAQMFAIGTLAVVAHTAFDVAGVLFPLAYAASRWVLVALYARGGRAAPHARPLTDRFVWGFTAGAALWTLSALLPMPWRGVVWAVALLVEFGTPLTASARKLYRRFPPDVPHLRERYALITLIVLGEGFIKTQAALAASAGGPGGAGLALAAAVFLVAVAVWWTYFGRLSHDPIRPGTATALRTIYVHLPLTAAITAFGVASKKLVVAEPTAALGDPYRWALALALAVVWGSLAVLGSALVQPRRGPVRRAVAAIAFVALGLASGLPTWAVAAAMLAIAGAATVLDARADAGPPHDAAGDDGGHAEVAQDAAVAEATPAAWPHGAPGGHASAGGHG